KTNVDAIINTNPYETFSQILQKMKMGDNDFLSIDGVYCIDKSKAEVVCYVPKYFPLREKLSAYAKYYRHSYLGPCVSIKTSFGCPHNCNFCLYAKGGYGKYWERDLEDVFDELKHIKESDIMILDDNFTAKLI
ncbi:MAG: B12-binding domain-containing radical SAM protein, partial [Firmicutes bacterium]|nr:B12-binding domain-containing radical SAM protein [Bacillota bacterium]